MTGGTSQPTTTGSSTQSHEQPKSVWLTLDDGPHSTRTGKILSILASNNIKATFFVLVMNVVKYPKLISQIAEQGHRIGNHSYSHPDLTKLDEGGIRGEISKTDTLISAYLGKDKIFRPPYGAHNKMVNKVAASLGYRVVLWNVDTKDWDADNQPDQWIEEGIQQIRAQKDNRVLTHDIQATTAQNYGNFIARIKAIGSVIFEPPTTL